MTTDPYTLLAITSSESTKQSQLETLRAWLAIIVPDIEINGLVIDSLLLRPLAERQASLEELIKVLRTYSLLEPLPVEAIADDDIRTRLRELQAEEYGLETSVGKAATGVLELHFSNDTSVLIPRGSQFVSASGVIAETSQPWRLRTTNTSDADVQPLIQIGADYVAQLPVTTVTIGALANVAVGTAFVPSKPLSQFLRATASTLFVGGEDPNSVTDLLNTFFDNRVTPSLATRDQILTLLRTSSGLGNIRSAGVVGFGDPEMHRDKTMFLPTGGSKVDVYVAAGRYPNQISVTLPATPISRVGAGPQKYTVSVGRNTAPGFLKILSVTRAGVTYKINNVARGLDMSPIAYEQVPLVTKSEYGTFSRFQTATIEIEDSTVISNPSNGATLPVQVQLLYHPGIDLIQTAMSSRQNRFPGGDVLVRSALPVFLSMQVRLHSTSEDNITEAVDFRSAILAEIYREPQRQSVYASDIVAAMSPYLHPTVNVDSVDFYANYLDTTGREISLNPTNKLVLPSNALNQLTSRTMSIYTHPSLIRFTIEKQLSPELP